MSNVPTKSTSLNPFREFSKMQNSFEKLFNEFFAVSPSESFGYSAPSCEVSEKGNHYIMKFDLPGVYKDDVKVAIDKNQMTVTAERREEKKSADDKSIMSEISYGTYQRTFTMPTPLDEKKVEAKFENGVLTVTLPKAETSQAKQIPVH